MCVLTDIIRQNLLFVRQEQYFQLGETGVFNGVRNERLTIRASDAILVWASAWEGPGISGTHQ